MKTDLRTTRSAPAPRRRNQGASPSIFFLGIIAGLVPVNPRATALAQIRSGWTQYFPAKTLQQENSVGYSSYTDVNGVETFKLWANPAWKVQDAP